MKSFTRCLVPTIGMLMAVGWSALLQIGCVNDEATGDVVTADITPTAAEVAMWSEATGERISPDQSGPSISAGCAHIQWCDEPGPWGTICIWDACDIVTAGKECAADARAVCGGTVPPIDIR